jgi:uncharacterized protein (DUF4415 family)
VKSTTLSTVSSEVRTKVNQPIRIDPDMLAAYRRQGKGWQTRINEVLREHMPPRK